MADGRQLEKAKNVVLTDIINSLLKTGNKTANIKCKNCTLYTLLTVTVFDPSPLTVCINCSFFAFMKYKVTQSAGPFSRWRIQYDPIHFFAIFLIFYIL